MKTKVLLLFVFAMMIMLAKIISNMEIGFLVAVTMMAIGGVIVSEKKHVGSVFVLTGTVSLFFNIFSAMLPPTAFPVVYFILALLGLVMALVIIVIMAMAEKEKTAVETEFGYMPERRKATTT